MSSNYNRYNLNQNLWPLMLQVDPFQFNYQYNPLIGSREMPISCYIRPDEGINNCFGYDLGFLARMQI